MIPTLDQQIQRAAQVLYQQDLQRIAVRQQATITRSTPRDTPAQVQSRVRAHLHRLSVNANREVQATRRKQQTTSF